MLREKKIILSHINLTNYNGIIFIILVGLTIYWLGVHFDYKLLYNYHITKMAVKAKNATIYISMLANTIWNLSHYYLHLLYYTCILSIITYTSTAQQIDKQKHIQILNKVQNKALYLIYVVFYITFTYTLELEASISFFGLYLDSLTKHTTIYFNKLNTNNPIL